MIVRIMQQCVIPILTYETETWVFAKRTVYKLQVTQRYMDRMILSITLKDKKPLQWIRQKTKMEDTGNTVMRMKWRRAGHVSHMEPNRWTWIQLNGNHGDKSRTWDNLH